MGLVYEYIKSYCAVYIIFECNCIRINIWLLLEIHSHVYHDITVTVVGAFGGNILRHFTSSIHKSIVNCVDELKKLCTLMLDNLPLTVAIRYQQHAGWWYCAWLYEDPVITIVLSELCFLHVMIDTSFPGSNLGWKEILYAEYFCACVDDD